MRKFLLLFLIFLFYPVLILAADKIEINTASLQQLDGITGIGPVLAQRIIDARPFSSVDDLDKVKGIGPATLQKIKDQGLAYVEGQTSQAPGGLVALQNSAVVNNTTPIQTPTIEPIGTINTPINNTSPVVYPVGIIINEVLPNPAGADETEEWIELYNSNNFDVDLAGWQLQDMVGTATTYIIPQNIKILSGGFLVFKRPETKIMLNNDQDGLNLLTPDKKIMDSINFTSAPLGQSYNKIGPSWQWSSALTPGKKNIASIAKTLSKTKNSVKNDGVAAGLADLSQNINLNQDNKTTNPWFLFFIVLATTVILAILVLLIKLRFGSKNSNTQDLTSNN